MGTNIITGFSNDLNILNVETGKSAENNGEFAKTLSETVKSVNVVDELSTAGETKIDVKDEFENNSSKVSEKISKNNENSDAKEVESVEKAETKEIDEDELKEAYETLVTAYETIVTAYADALEIPEDVVKQILEENNISASDLLDSSNVQNIVMLLEGIENATEILTDPELYDSIVELEKETKDVVNDLFNDSFDNFEPLKADDKINDLIKNVQTESKDDKEPENNFEAMQMKSETYVENTSSESFDTNQVSYTPNAQEIYDQIGEYIKTLNTESLKEVELQLQPETLGTVQIKVSQREGVMTAEMFTSNDTARAALESQLIQLKEDFENAGLKVETIEVKVSTNAFNENAEEDSRNEANEEAERLSNQTRRINISDLGDLEEIDEMEDDEKIATEMMTANGNSLDYKA